MMSEMKTVMLFISLIASLSKVSQGFEIPCNASNSTVKIVQFCPLDEQTYTESAKKKNCPAILNNCKSFEYHCLPNRQRAALIEVCAPSLNIIGNVCGTYHEGFNSIRRTEIPCPNCPFSYSSTEQFRSPVCYELLTSSTVPQNTAPQELSSSPPVSAGTIKNETKDKFFPDILIENKKNITKDGLQPGITINTQSQWKWEYILIAALGLAFGGSILFIIVEKTRKKGNSRSKTDVEANISPDDDLKARLLSKEDQIEIQRTGQRSMAISAPDCTEMSDKYQTPNTPDCMDNSVSSQTLFYEQLPSSLTPSEQPTAEANKSETSNSRTDVQADIFLDINPAGPCLSERVKVETQRKVQRIMTTSSPDCTEMTDKDQTPKIPDCKDKSVSSQTFNEQQPSSLMSSEQPTAEPNESDVSMSSKVMSMDYHSEDQGQSDIAGFVPERQEMSDKEQTLPLNKSDCMDNHSYKDQPKSATFSGQPTDETIGSSQSRSLPAETSYSKTDIQANISSDINSAYPIFSEEIQVETQQTGQRSMASASSYCTEMSDKNKTLPPNTPDCMDKAVSSQTSYKEQQTTSPIASEQPTAEPNDSETSNSKADVQTNISSDINPAGPGFSEEVKVETQRKGHGSIASSSLDCTEMSDRDQTSNIPDCKDKSVSSQTSSNQQQPFSLMSSEQPTAEPNQSDVSRSSMDMSIEDHSEDQGQSDIAGFVPERQEMSDKEQRISLIASVCVENHSCKDQPKSATFSGQPTGETIGSSQSRSLAAVSPLKAGTDNEATLKAVDDFENQPLVNIQIVSSKDSISTQETSATEDPDKNQQSEASMVRKPPDKRFIPVEDNTNQNPVNTGSKKSQIAINVFGNSNDNANFSICIDRTQLDIPLSATISRENINQHPKPKKDPKAMKKNCTAELEIRGSGTTPIFNDDADQEQSFFYNQEDIENMDINFLRHENRELKEEILKLKDLREREKMIERREKNMAKRERVMAEREKMLRDIEKTHGRQKKHQRE